MPASSTWFRRAWRRRQRPARRRRSICRSGPRRRPTPPWWPSVRSPPATARAVDGWLFDARNTANPQVLGKQYNEAASEESARTIAHRFADEIILRLGGGINGIAETKIYFISTRTGTKEVWVMDYDGQNQHAVTHLGTISISPRISPDNSRLAFASLGRDGWTIRMYSLELNRYVAFPAGTAGRQQPISCMVGGRLEDRVLLFAHRQSGDLAGRCERRQSAQAHQLQGSQRRPTFNPRTGAQIAWVSGRTGCRRSTPWTSTAQTCSASRMAAMPFPVVVAEWPVAGLQLESQIRAGRSGRRRHSRDRPGQQGLPADHARVGQQRLSFLGSRQPPHRVSAHHRRPHRDLDHASRWNAQQQLTAPATTPCPTGAGSDFVAGDLN
jgi:hypothetical protein